MYMTSALSPLPGIDPRMPIESGWPTVSQTLTIAHRRLLSVIASAWRAAAPAGAAAMSRAISAKRCAQRGHTLTIPSACRGFRCCCDESAGAP